MSSVKSVVYVSEQHCVNKVLCINSTDVHRYSKIVCALAETVISICYFYVGGEGDGGHGWGYTWMRRTTVHQ